MHLVNFTVQLARKTGDIILKESKENFKIQEKRKNDLVTSADKAAENFIIKNIKKNYPEHSILSEEASFVSAPKISDYHKSKYIWVIDPLDGTTNFAHGLPIYSLSIGLFKVKSAESSKNFDYLSGDIILGVVYAPAMKELFYAIKGKGAYLNGKKIKVSKAQKVENSLMVTGFPYINKKINLPYFSAMLDRAQAVRRLGSAALDLCYIAAGRFDGYWEFGLKPWDVAAGALIVEEAGGKVTDINGNLLDLFGADILATNGKIHQETINSFRKIS